MSTLKVLIKKEVLQFKRNSFLPKLVIVFPIMIMLVLPWVTTMDVRHINVSVVDNDHSQFSARLIAKINASDYFTLHSVTASFTPSMQMLEKGEVDAILEIPADYEKSMVTGEPKKLNVSANSVNATKGSLGSQYLAQTIGKAVQELRASHMPVKSSELVTIQNRYNPTLEYRNFMIPGLMVMLLIIVTGFLPALNFVSEKEIGTIEQINVTPVNRFTFTLAKLIVYWVAGLIVITIAMLVAWLVYGLAPIGSLLTIYAILNDGSKWYYTTDVTTQMHKEQQPGTEPQGDEDDEEITIDVEGLPIPKPISDGGGFEPTIDGWQSIEIEVGM